MPDPMLTTAEVAEILGRSVATINRWVATGRLTPAVKLPGLRGANLFTRRDVERLRKADAA